MSGSDQIQALPIFLLVLGALSFGIGAWGLVRQPPSTLIAVIGGFSALVFFVAAGINMRRRGVRFSGEPPA